MEDLNYISISRAHELLKLKKITAQDLVGFYIDKIKNLNPKVKAVITLVEKEALTQAKEIDAKIARGEEIGLLEGIPYTAKEMFMTKGIKTTASSKILEEYVAPYSSTAIEKLDRAGAILIGKVNQDEFGHGASTENSAYHVTHNPWDLELVSGGSSGGSAAAVAVDFGMFSLGTDTGGSSRQPAAFCGVTGFKPSYGAISRYGVIAMASSFDTVGILARSSADAEAVFGVIAGVDSKDSTTVGYDFASIGENVSAAYFGVNNIIDENIKQHKIDGIKVEDYMTIEDFGVAEEALAAYYVLVPSEISSNLERYDGIRYGSSAKAATNLTETYTKTRGEYFGPEVNRRNLIGTYALSAGYYDAYYKKAMRLRTKIRKRVDELLEKYDVILMPTTVEPAFKISAKSDPIEMYKADLLAVFVNLAGVPSVSIPFGFDESSGLPMGLQIIGKQGDDKKILEIADRIQKVTNYHEKIKELEL